MSAVPSNANATGKRQGFLSGLTSGGGAGRTVFIAATATGVMAVVVTAIILGSAADTATYYVLNVDVAARTPITAEMLKPVTTSAASIPKSYDQIFLQENEVFAKYPLRADETVTASNTGPLESISKDLPPGFVVASMAAPPENAVAGKIRRGDYVDVYATGVSTISATNPTGDVTKLVLHHMLILDVTVSPSTITEAAGDEQPGSELNPGPESAAARGGIPALYTVAVTPQDAAKIALIRGKDIFLTLSSNDGGKGPLNVQTRVQDVFDEEEVGDSGAGTAEAVKAAQTDGATPPVAPPATPAATPTLTPNRAPARTTTRTPARTTTRTPATTTVRR